MLSSIRRHITYANVAATIALVLAMSGGALAANHYLINSTRQIKPSVLRYLHGRSGANGLNGLNRRHGKTGATGKNGSSGKNGAAAGFYTKPGLHPHLHHRQLAQQPRDDLAEGPPRGQLPDRRDRPDGHVRCRSRRLRLSHLQARRRPKQPGSTFTSALGAKAGGYGASGEIPLQIDVELALLREHRRR